MKQAMKGSDILFYVKKVKRETSKQVFEGVLNILNRVTGGDTDGGLRGIAANIGDAIGSILSKGFSGVDMLRDFIGNIIPDSDKDGVISEILDMIKGVSPIEEYIPVACQRNMTISRSSDTIDITCKGDDIRAFLQGFPSVEISCDGVRYPDEESYNILVETWEKREPLAFEIMEKGRATHEGFGIITSLEEASPYDDAATYALTFSVSGKYHRV